MKYQRQKLYNIIGDPLVTLFKQCNVIVAGGAITSIFCNREVVDIDVYVRSEKDLVALVTRLYKDYYVLCHTSKATLFINREPQVQVIHIGYFESAEDIFVNFDFTVCMGAYDFSIETFVLHPDFLLHNSQRIMEFNGDTKFPLMSALIVQKYKDKGYGISKAEFLKIIIACMDLQVTSYAQLKEHLGGMYGFNMDKLFDETKEFSLKDAMAQLSNLYLSDDYYKEPTKLPFESVDYLIDNILKKPCKYFESNGAKYLIHSSGNIKRVTVTPENSLRITPKEYFAEHRLIKYVKAVDGKYFSYHDKTFEYPLGETVTARGNFGAGIFCGLNERALIYEGNDGATLIELEFIDDNDILYINDSVVQLRKAKFVKVLP